MGKEVRYNRVGSLRAYTSGEEETIIIRKKKIVFFLIISDSAKEVMNE